MKKSESEANDALRPDYDLRSLRVRKLGTKRKSFGGTFRVKHDAQEETKTMVIPGREELLEAARRRVSLPPGELWLDYQDDVDTLYIRLKEKTQPTRSESDLDNGVVFDYEGEELVGIEIMDITGQLKHANPS